MAKFKGTLSIMMLTGICSFHVMGAEAHAPDLLEDYSGAHIIYKDDTITGPSKIINPFIKSISAHLQKTPSKWDVLSPDLAATSTGIEVTYEKCDPENTRTTDTIIYTIPEDYNGDITINATEDIFRTIGGIYLPGESVPLTIKIINNSGNEYSYLRNSMIISTENYNQYELNVVSDAYGFDSSPILLGHTTKRSGNTAIQALYHCSGTDSLTQMQVRDTNLSPLLMEAGYTKGTEDLGRYYLDFYNQKYELSAEKLEDLPDDVISELFSGTNLREVETCTQISELGYNWFYNRLISVVPDGKKYNDELSSYTIGSYMRKEVSYDSFCLSAFHKIKNGTYSLKTMNIYFNETYMGQAYHDINLNLCVGFKLKQVSP